MNHFRLFVIRLQAGLVLEPKDLESGIPELRLDPRNRGQTNGRTEITI